MRVLFLIFEVPAHNDCNLPTWKWQLLHRQNVGLYPHSEFHQPTPIKSWFSTASKVLQNPDGNSLYDPPHLWGLPLPYQSKHVTKIVTFHLPKHYPCSRHTFRKIQEVSWEAIGDLAWNNPTGSFMLIEKVAIVWTNKQQIGLMLYFHLVVC